MADTRHPRWRYQVRSVGRHGPGARSAMPRPPIGPYQPAPPLRPGNGQDNLVDSGLRGLEMLMSLSTEKVATNSPTPGGTGQVAVPRPGRIRSGRLTLAAILIAQAALSLHLVWSNTAYTDEALYLWAGHLEWTHWLHGIRLPFFPTYFSGAPVIYPPLGALADSIGGLAGARTLSLCFMLGATTLLWSTTSRLYGREAAFFASALWAFLGPTLMLGAFATFDAMSLFLVTLAVWCATAHHTRDEATGWMVAGAVALALANAAKYASTIFDPAVILLAMLACGLMRAAKLRSVEGCYYDVRIWHPVSCNPVLRTVLQDWHQRYYADHAPAEPTRRVRYYRTPECGLAGIRACLCRRCLERYSASGRTARSSCCP